MQPFQLFGVQGPVAAFGGDGGRVIVQFAVQGQHGAVVGQIIALHPVAGLDGIRRAADGIHQHRKGVHVVFQVQAVGQGIVQGLLQLGEPVGVVALVQGVERKPHQQAVHGMAAVQHIVRQVQGLL